MNIPEPIQQRMQQAKEPSEEGVVIAVEFLGSVLEQMRDRIAGVYLMPPFKRYHMAVEIMERIGVMTSVA